MEHVYVKGPLQVRSLPTIANIVAQINLSGRCLMKFPGCFQQRASRVTLLHVALICPVTLCRRARELKAHDAWSCTTQIRYSEHYRSAEVHVAYTALRRHATARGIHLLLPFNGSMQTFLVRIVQHDKTEAQIMRKRKM